MRGAWALLIVAAGIGTVVQAGHAADIHPRVNLLMQVCAANAYTKDTPCGAWILGEVDGVNAGQHLAHGKLLFCLPAEAGPVEKIGVVRKYMQDHPEKMSLDLGETVASALAAGYPCPHKR